ncbi:carboxypeptidase regulatory-like domain-containing protein [Spirosoma taeanense]|uniref:carboxypeptidase regulatory-like domain-containing protein n=1 Tax=Spirosoma taeanense TaxID=2735870 RepID=UPI001F04CA59|nr:carboxypeptidase regulatory-like domain-containing protein [Spirosoma taeanense]
MLTSVALLGRATVTNELGQYRFVNLPPSPYRLELSFVGYQSQTVSVVVQADHVTTVQTRLSTVPIALYEVTVSALKAHD